MSHIAISGHGEEIHLLSSQQSLVPTVPVAPTVVPSNSAIAIAMIEYYLGEVVTPNSILAFGNLTQQEEYNGLQCAHGQIDPQQMEANVASEQMWDTSANINTTTLQDAEICAFLVGQPTQFHGHFGF